ncbi:MAG: S8 family serine peptidase [Anaerolineae bacterium]
MSRSSISARVFCLLILLLGLFVLNGGSTWAEGDGDEYPSAEVVVKPQPGVPIARINARYGTATISRITETNLYLLALPPGETVEELLPQLNADPDVLYAELNYYAEHPDTGQRYFGASGGPGARGYYDQWAVATIQAARAHPYSTGAGVIVAVLDTGVDLDHPALVDRLVPGYDFVGMDSDPSDAPNGLDDDSDGLVDEGTGHGSHVAGIVALVAPGANIMPVRVLNSDGIGTYYEIAQGIVYAADHGARVLNLSLTAPHNAASLEAALEYAFGRGCVIVAAAGNGGGAGPAPYPAAYKRGDDLYVIAVGASDRQAQVASFSATDPDVVDVYAPGVDIYSTYYDGGYAWWSGTSMAAPFVAGEAALLGSLFEWNGYEVARWVREHVVPIDPSNRGESDQEGPGRIDVHAAVAGALSSLPP